MSNQLIKSCIFLLLLSVNTQIQSAFIFDPSLQWKTLHTEHFEIHYHDGEAELATKIAATAERIHTEITRYLRWTPKTATQIVVIDRMDISNGAATPVPRNTMFIIVTPPDDTSVLGDFDDWLDLLIRHEYTHIVHIDKAWGGASVLRGIFGRFLFAFPNIFQPLWMIEGLATFKESDADRAIGRGQNAYFKALMRLELESGIKSIYHVNQSTNDWPMGTIRYLYGVYFFNFIRDRYGEEKIQTWIQQYSNNMLPFSIRSNARLTFGRELRTLWKEFEVYLNEQFQPTIEKITAQGLSKPIRLTNIGYFTANPRVSANGDIYYIQSDLLHDTKLMLISKNQPAQVVTNIHGTNFDLHPEAGILLSYLDFFDSTNLYSDLYKIDLTSGEKTQLTFGQRYLYATWSPDGKQIIAVENNLAEKALHLLSASGKLIKVLWQGTNGEIVGPPDWSPNGEHLVAPVWRSGKRWNLELFSLSNNKWRTLTNDKHIKTQPQFTADGNNILYCADYDGIYNAYQLNLTSNKIDKLTNLIGGAFSISPMADGNGFIYLGLNSKGFDVYQINNMESVSTVSLEHQETKVGKNGNQIHPIESDVVKHNITDYSPFANLLPTSWFPVIYVTDEETVIGASTFGGDPLLRHQYAVAAARDYKNDWTIGELIYIYDRWNPTFKMHASREVVVKLDSDEKLSSARTEDILSVEFIWPFLKRDRQLSAHIGLVNKKEKDKLIVNSIDKQADDENKLLGLALSYNSSKYFPRAISRNTGQQFRIVGEDYHVFENDYTGEVYSTDWRGYYAITAEHVFATRVALGWGTEQPDPFRLGGPVKGYSIASPIRPFGGLTDNEFGKRDFALRGYPTGLPYLVGRRMFLTEIEWRFPLFTIDRGFMGFPIAVNRIHGKAFYNAGSTWQDDYDSSNIFNGAGIEVTTEVVIGYHAFPFDVRVGYAHGFDKGGEDQFYLSIGGTF